MTTKQELEFIDYVKSKVKFEEDKCSYLCDYFDQACGLFGGNIWLNNRDDDCKKFFND